MGIILFFGSNSGEKLGEHFCVSEVPFLGEVHTAIDNSFIESEPVFHGSGQGVFKIGFGIAAKPENIPVEAFVLEFVDVLDSRPEAMEFVLVFLVQSLGMHGVVVCCPQFFGFGE